MASTNAIGPVAPDGANDIGPAERAVAAGTVVPQLMFLLMHNSIIGFLLLWLLSGF